MRGILISVFVFLCSVNLSAQEDSMYIKYDAIIGGISVSGTQEAMDFNYQVMDSTWGTERMDYDLQFNSKNSVGLVGRTKYGSAYISIKPLSDLLNKNQSVLGSWKLPVKRSFGFTLYPEQYLLNFRYTHVSGVLYNDYDSLFPGQYEHYVLLEDFRMNYLKAGGTYFFNKNFSFSRAHSSLYFPKKSVFSFSLGSVFHVRKMASDSGFLPDTRFYTSVGDNFYNYYTWNYADKVTFFGFDITPGIEVFLTRNRFKKPNRGFPGYYQISFSTGPAFYYVNIAGENDVYSKRGRGSGFSVTSIGRIGFNMNLFYLEFFYNVYFNRMKIHDYEQMVMNSYVGLTFGYRIPAGKLYEKTDKKLEEWKSKVKEKVIRSQ